MSPVAPATIIELWFSPRVRPLWFRSTPAFDVELRTTHLENYEQAASGALDHWQATASGCLALVILLDQFPLNMFRGTARAFEAETLARNIAQQAIDRGFDTELSPEQKAFLYMPFMHSEDLTDQDRSVALYAAAGLTGNLEFAHHHRGIIQRFGRFPHRNALLSRPSTDEENAYLASPGAFTG